MEDIRERKRILQMRDLQRQHEKDAEKLIKEGEKRSDQEDKRIRAIEANQKIKELTARDVYTRKCLGSFFFIPKVTINTFYFSHGET